MKVPLKSTNWTEGLGAQHSHPKSLSSHLNGEHPCKEACKNAMGDGGEKEVEEVFFMTNYSSFHRI